MDRDALTAWALRHGWQMIAGMPSLTRPSQPKVAIVRMVLKVTVASIEIKKPAGKWERVSGAAYGDIAPDAETGVPRGLGLVSLAGLTGLMQENADRAMIARVSR